MFVKLCQPKNREVDDVRIWVLLLGTTYMSSSFPIWSAILSCCGYLVTSEDAEADKSSFVSWQPHYRADWIREKGGLVCWKPILTQLHLPENTILAPYLSGTSLCGEWHRRILLHFSLFSCLELWSKVRFTHILKSSLVNSKRNSYIHRSVNQSINQSTNQNIGCCSYMNNIKNISIESPSRRNHRI